MSDSSPLPVVCDRCRSTGIAGDPAFAQIPDLLAFDPVPVRAHVNNWTAEHQRAFIAALALTGSVNAAARSIGRYTAGADRLRKARGGRSFAEAWDSALDIARDRELAEIHDHATDFAYRQQGKRARAQPSADFGYGPTVHQVYGDDYDPTEFADGHAEYVEARGRIRDKMMRARRLLLAELAEDPAKRAAWELLVGPVDWDKAERMEAQDDEPPMRGGYGEPSLPSMHGADMQLCHERGFLGEFTGVGMNLDQEIARAIAEYRDSTESKLNDGAPDASA